MSKISSPHCPEPRSFALKHRLYRVMVSALLFALLGMIIPVHVEAATQTAMTASSYGGSYYVVKRGDTLAKIARWHGTTVRALMKANGLYNGNRIYTGQRLHIPGASSNHYSGGHGYGGSGGGYGCALYYRVRHGDTLSQIALYHGVNAHALARTNGIYNLHHVYVGQKLCIPAGYKPPQQKPPQYKPLHYKPPQYKPPVHPPKPPHYDSCGYYRVRPGDTLAKIAYWHGTTVYHLAHLNHLSNVNVIEVGHYLHVPDKHCTNPTKPPKPKPHPPVDPGHWTGSYYNNKDLAGDPVYTRHDVDIHFDWGTEGPGGGVPNDYFSVAWTRTLYFSAGTYRFFATVDDGVRVYVDNELIIDSWHEQPATNYFGDKYLSDGHHTIRVEYFEQGGFAKIYARWGKL